MPGNPTDDALLALFHDAFDAQRRALAPLIGEARRARTDRPGQYMLDLVADAAVLEVLGRADVAIVSEESGVGGVADAPTTVVLDPVDGSTNCSRGIPYWAISLCAVDADGPRCALVANGATGECTTAVRGGGAFHGGTRLEPSSTTHIERAVVALDGMVPNPLPWRQFRALGSAALSLCDVAAGRVDGYLVAGSNLAPWDYLGGLLVCREAGAVVEDVQGLPLVSVDPGERRQVLAAATPELFAALRPAVEPPLDLRPDRA